MGLGLRATSPRCDLHMRRSKRRCPKFRSLPAWILLTSERAIHAWFGAEPDDAAALMNWQRKAFTGATAWQGHQKCQEQRPGADGMTDQGIVITERPFQPRQISELSVALPFYTSYRVNLSPKGWPAGGIAVGVPTWPHRFSLQPQSKCPTLTAS
jgi:hypothetical protein